MKTIFLIQMVILVAFLSSCRERIDLELNNAASRIVIEATLTTEHKEHEVRITRSAAFLDDNAAPVVTDAVVTLSDGQQVVMLTHTGNGIYKTIPAMAAVVGKSYTLNVLADGINYSASESVLPVAPIDSLLIERAFMAIQPGVVWEAGKKYYNLGLYSQEPGNEVNYYIFDAYKNGILHSDTITKKFFSDDVFLNGSYIQGMYVYQIDAEPGDTIMVKMSSVSRDFYLYVVGLSTVSMNGSPFVAPPSNLKNNFSNHALGFFRCSAVSEIEGIIK